MRVVVWRGGDRVAFHPAGHERLELEAELPTLYPSARGHLGSWIEAVYYLQKHPEVQVLYRNRLTSFLRERQDLLQKNGGDYEVRWLREGEALREYQKAGIAAALRRRRILIADSTGIGKTPQGIGVYCFIRQIKPKAKGVFIVLSQRRLQWAGEFEKFVDPEFLDPFEDVAVVFGDKAQRMRAIEQDAPVTILHYESLLHDIQRQEYRDETGKKRTHLYGPLIGLLKEADIVVLDEVPRVKNWSSKTHKWLAHLLQETPFVVGLSATPYEKSVLDLYNIFQVLRPWSLGGMNSFRHAYAVEKTTHYGRRKVSKVVDAKNLGHLRQRIQHIYIRRTAKEVGEELPPLIPCPLLLVLSPKARKAYIDIQEAGRTGRLEDAGRACMRARRFCDDPSLLQYDIASEKTQTIIDLVQNDLAEESVLIFSEFRTYCVLLDEALGDQSDMIVGGIPDVQRQSNEDRFNEGSLRILVGDQAMEMGANLQTASVVINADLPWLPKALQQRAGRAQRIGAKANKIRVFTVIIEDTIEERMLKQLLKRAGTFEAIFQEGMDFGSPFEGLTLKEMNALL